MAQLSGSRAFSGPCPCGLGEAYADCCGRLHRGQAAAATAERLLRSRYSAFVVQDREYLLRTWSSGHRPRALHFDPGMRWTGLHILGRTGGSAFHTAGTVEFVARFEQDGTPGQHHENSAFVREDGDWVYQQPVDLRAG